MPLHGLSEQMRALTRRRRLLSEHDEVLYYGPPGKLEEAVIVRAVGSLHQSKPLIDVQPKNTVARDPEETISWIRWYSSLQVAYHRSLRKETNHDLTLLLVVAKDRYQLDVIFRMSKSGFGNIQYRLSVQKIEDDLCLCYEG